jgi:uncharacterized protein YecT (DUF1311 family)
MPPLRENTDFFRSEAIGIEGKDPPSSRCRRLAVNGLMFPRRIRHSAHRHRWGDEGALESANKEMGTMSDTVTVRMAAVISAGSLLALAIMAGNARPASSQEFDCRNAEFASERTICGSDGLSALDDRMSQLYRELKAASSNRYQRDDLKDYQHQFLNARDACGPDSECIRGAYLDQISVLEGRIEQAYRRSER